MPFFKELLSPAKINLFLYVVGKRSDGYHELISLICPINLYDRIRIVQDESGLKVTCSDPDVPVGEENIAAQAYRAFYRACGLRPERISIHIEKSIPVAAGLGGGSSNAATVLRWLNEKHGRPLSEKSLYAVGASVGADVPFFLMGRPALAMGIGDNLVPWNGEFPYHLLIVNPGFQVSTANIFAEFNLGLTKDKKNHNYQFFEGIKPDILRHFRNDLESVAIKRFPVIGTIKEELGRAGAVHALMSGSGPTVFGLFSEYGRLADARMLFGARQGFKVFEASITG